MKCGQTANTRGRKLAFYESMRWHLAHFGAFITFGKVQGAIYY